MNDAAIESAGIPRCNSIAGTIVGKICLVSEEGQVWVDYPGNPGDVVSARIGVSPDETLAVDCEVLLVFPPDDEGPIICGVVRDRLLHAGRHGVKSNGAKSNGVKALPVETVVDGKRIVLDGREEIVLRCGKGSITLRKDGKIVVKGTHIVSRATGMNRIKGGSVAVN